MLGDDRRLHSGHEERIGAAAGGITKTVDRRADRQLFWNSINESYPTRHAVSFFALCDSKPMMVLVFVTFKKKVHKTCTYSWQHVNIIRVKSATRRSISNRWSVTAVTTHCMIGAVYIDVSIFSFLIIKLLNICNFFVTRPLVLLLSTLTDNKNVQEKSPSMQPSQLSITSA